MRIYAVDCERGAKLKRSDKRDVGGRNACARGSADVTVRAASVRRSTLPIRRQDRRLEGRQVGIATQGGASDIPGPALENGCCRGAGRSKIAAAVGKGEHRNCHVFSLSLLLLFKVFNRDPN